MADELGITSVAPQRGREALKAIGWSLQKPRPKNPGPFARRGGGIQKKLADAVAEEAAHFYQARWRGEVMQLIIEVTA
jgi:hypothetical protein